LKVNEPHVGQRHEDMESKWEYYQIIVSPERKWKKTSEDHSNGTLPQVWTC